MRWLFDSPRFPPPPRTSQTTVAPACPCLGLRGRGLSSGPVHVLRIE